MMTTQPKLSASQILQMAGSVGELREKWTHAGQGHVFQYYAQLSIEQQEKLIKQVRVCVDRFQDKFNLTSW